MRTGFPHGDYFFYKKNLPKYCYHVIIVVSVMTTLNKQWRNKNMSNQSICIENQNTKTYSEKKIQLYQQAIASRLNEAKELILDGYVDDAKESIATVERLIQKLNEHKLNATAEQ